MEPSQETLDALIEASATMLRLSIEPEWMPAVRMNLAVSYRLANLVEEAALPEEIEPAPVYGA